MRGRLLEASLKIYEISWCCTNKRRYLVFHNHLFLFSFRNVTKNSLQNNQKVTKSPNRSFRLIYLIKVMESL